MILSAANLSCRRSAAQAILASLLAKATTATLRWARANNPFAHRPRIALSDIGQRPGRSVDQLSAQIFVAALADSEQLRFAIGRELPGTKPSQAARSRLSDRPTAATSADAMSAPTPGIVVSRRASSFSFAQRTNSASKAAIRRSSSAHCARASAMSSIIRGLPAPPCSSISTARNCSSFRLPCAATNPRSSGMARS